MKVIRLMLVLALLVALAACAANLDPNAPEGVNTGSLDFTRFYTVGTSLTAGWQSGGLVGRFQENSFPNQIAKTVGASFVQPVISNPGIPATWFVASYSPLDIDTLPGLGSLTNATFPMPFNNLGIPGSLMGQLTTKDASADAMFPFFEIVLRNNALGANAMAQAEAVSPTLLFFWAGNNDVLGSATNGTDALMTPAASFEASYIAAMDRAVAAAQDVVTSNVFPITAIPFFTTIPPIVIDPATNQPVLDPSNNVIPLIGEFQGGSGPLPITSLVTLGAGSLLAQGIGIPVALGGTGNPLPDAVILDPTEQTNINDRITAFNTTIDTVATNRGVPVVDINQAFQSIQAAGGVTIRDQEFTLDYVSGGLLSLDGVHPSTLGYYVIAQEFVKVMNAAFGAAIPEPAVPTDVVRRRDYSPQEKWEIIHTYPTGPVPGIGSPRH